MNTFPPLLTRPTEIAKAVGLLWASLVIGGFRTALDWHHLELVSPNLVFTLSTLGLTFAITAFLIWKIGRGRNTFLVLFLIGSVPYFFIARADFQRSPAVAVIGVAQALIQAFALWIMFASPGRLWFSAKQCHEQSRGERSI